VTAWDSCGDVTGVEVAVVGVLVVVGMGVFVCVPGVDWGGDGVANVLVVDNGVGVLVGGGVCSERARGDPDRVGGVAEMPEAEEE
jgi:hypothetical protein